MRTITSVCLLLLAVSTAWADCPEDFSASECHKYSLIENAFVQASKDATSSLITGILSASSRRAQIYQAALELFREQAALAIKAGKLTKELAASLLEDLKAEYAKAKDAASHLAGDALDAIIAAQKKILQSLQDLTETIVKDFPARKEQLKEALANARQKLQEIVTAAIDKANSGLGKVQGFFERMLKKVTGSKVFQGVKKKFDDLMKKLTGRVSAEITDGIEPAVEAAALSTEEVLFGLQMDEGMEKREFEDLWNRVKAAVIKIGGRVYKEALEILEEKKPEIMAQLQKIAKAIGEATEKIVTKLADQLIKKYLSE